MGEGGRQGLHCGTRIRLDGHRRGIHRGQLDRIDVDPDDLARNLEFRQEVITRRDFRADQQHQIGIGQCLLACPLKYRATEGQRV
jgi:hypothetical protein